MSKVFVESYLFFGGRCEEALKFYQTAIGAKIGIIMRYNESPEPIQPGMLAPGFENKIMHAVFRVGETAIMASDGCGGEDAGKFEGFSLSLAVPDEAEADRAFAALSEGGEVQMPLTKTFWSPRFGMLKDRFGIGWMVNVIPPAT